MEISKLLKDLAKRLYDLIGQKFFNKTKSS